MVAVLQVCTHPVYKQNLFSDLQRDKFLPRGWTSSVQDSLSTRSPEARAVPRTLPGECRLREQRAFHPGVVKLGNCSLPCHPPGGTVAGTPPGALRRLAPPSPCPPLRCREARPPWSSSPSPRLLRNCCAGTPVPAPGTLSWPVAPWEGALLPGQRD